MKTNPDSPTQISPVLSKSKRSFWRKLGGGSLSISLFIHIVLLAIGVIWVFQVVAPVEKNVTITPRSGGGTKTAETKVRQKQVEMMQKPSRIIATGFVSNITLPEPQEMTAVAAVGRLSSGLLGDTGKTEGNGGTAQGLNIGDGLLPGMTSGDGTKTPFGISNLDKNALVGTFYDFKQTSDRKPTEMTDDQMRGKLQEIVKHGFDEQDFEKYYKAPRKLYQTKLCIPVMTADAAPAAFECANEVLPRRWVVVYRGAVQAPKSGRFRFVGAGDDVLAVRFNNHAVFDYGYTIAGSGTHGGGYLGASNARGNGDLAKEIRKDTPMRLPLTFYKYSQTPRWNKDLGGLAVGPEFEAREGSTYPIEILIAEIPGGYFGVSLMIEEIGVNYDKDPGGAPILPLFRLDSSLPAPESKGETPPCEADGPIWKFAQGGAGPAF